MFFGFLVPSDPVKAPTRHELDATVYPILLLFLPNVLIHLVIEYRGFFLKFKEMTELYHRLGMGNLRHRINYLLFDPPETWSQFCERLYCIVEGPSRYLCVLIE